MHFKNHMIEEYQIVIAQEADDLPKLVNAEIQKGWQPIGGLAITSWEDTSDYCPGIKCTYFQAMVKMEPKIKDFQIPA